jgi:hypothetical protein
VSSHDALQHVSFPSAWGDGLIVEPGGSTFVTGERPAPRLTL